AAVTCVALLVLASPLASTAGEGASTYEPLPSRTTLIRGAVILDGKGGRLADGDLLLRDGRIAALGADLAAPEGANVIDATGRWVTPGIIDVHSHLGNATFPLVPVEVETWDVNEATDPNTAGVQARHGLN